MEAYDNDNDLSNMLEKFVGDLSYCWKVLYVFYYMLINLPWF